MIVTQRASLLVPLRILWGWVLRGLCYLATSVLIFLVRLYRFAVSPFFPSSCRFLPTCSRYALDALYKHSPDKAVTLIFSRTMKCHPWGSSGHDPVPD